MSTTTLQRMSPGLFALTLCASVGATGCKKDEPAPTKDVKSAEPATEAKEVAKAEAEAKTETKAEPPKPADALAAAPDAAAVELAPIERGKALGHVMLANPSQFISEVKTQAAPSMAQMFISDEMLRNWAAGTLGEQRQKVAQNVKLDAPIGCAVVEMTETEMPIACVFGYTGGAEAFVTDMGTEGKDADPKGHKAIFKLEGEEMFVDELGGDKAVVSNHAAVFEAAKPYIEQTMLGRAGSLGVDLEAVGFLAPIMVRYQKELEPFFKEMSNPSSLPKGDDPFTKAFASYSEKAAAYNIDAWKNMQQVRVGLGLDPKGMLLVFEVMPVAGSALETQMKAMAGTEFDVAKLGALPASTWMAFGADYSTSYMETEMIKAVRDLGLESYAEATKKDAAAVKASVEQYTKESLEVLETGGAFGVAHLPDTVGGFIIEGTVKPGKSYREFTKKWFAGVTPEALLGAEAAQKVKWTMTPDAATHAEVAIDRWVIEPTEEGKKELLTNASPETKQFEQRTGGFKLIIDFAEVDGRTLTVVSMADAMPYTKAAIDAIKGTGTLAQAPKFEELKAMVGQASTVVAVDMQRGSEWLKGLMPPEEAAKIPAAIGTGLTDVAGYGRVTPTGASYTIVRVSQAFIDQLKKLAE